MSCAPHPVAPPSPGTVEDGPAPQLLPEAVAGVQHPALRRLLHDDWERRMRQSPVWATSLGDRRFDDRLGDTSPAAQVAHRARLLMLLRRAKGLSGVPMSEADQVTLGILLDNLQGDQGTGVCAFERWVVSPRNNAFSDMASLPMQHAIDGPADAATYLARMQQVPAAVEGRIANLRLGRSDGRVAEAEGLRRTVEMLDRKLAVPVGEWAAMAPAAEPVLGWDGPTQAAWAAELEGVMEGAVRPAMERYRAVLADELLPHARSPQQAGMVYLEDGAACYAALVRQHTTTELNADEIHEIGLAQLAQIHAEFSEVGLRALGTADRAEIFDRLRTDPALRFETSDEVAQAAADALAAAQAAAPGFFETVPKADCTVHRIPDFEAPYTTIAYYRPPVPGAEGGRYYINTHAPETRPRHEARVLAYHEAIPGHHTQVAIGQELGALPAVRRHLLLTPYIEGWALYAERLADEMGLYEDDLDRLGMLSFDAWRAARLVVDTGLHHKGWSRQQAVAFMGEATPLAPNNIDNEVDRYIGWPGQALGYKLGQLEILRLRADAEHRLGEGFRLAGFHEAVLGAGAMPLPMLAARVERWVAERAQATAPRSGEAGQQGLPD